MPDNDAISAEELRTILENMTTPIWECDEAFWAREKRVQYPLTHYDQDTFDNSRREGAPEARLASDQGALLSYLEETWPGSRVDIKAQNGRVAIEILITGLEMGISGQFLGELPMSRINRGLALAFRDAHEGANRIRQRFASLEDVAAQATPVRTWPIEELSPGRFSPVNHELRLQGVSFGTPEAALRNADSNRGGLYGIMQARDRYEASFPAPAVSTDPPGLVWMTGTPESVLSDAYTAGPETEPDVLALNMQEGEILIGKDRTGTVQVVREKGPEGLSDVDGGLDALRTRPGNTDGPQP